MREKTRNHAGFLQGPVKLADMARTGMYRDYLANWSSVVGRRSSVKKINVQKGFKGTHIIPPIED